MSILVYTHKCHTPWCHTPFEKNAYFCRGVHMNFHAKSGLCSSKNELVMLNLVFGAWRRPHRPCEQPTYRAARFAPANNNFKAERSKAQIAEQLATPSTSSSAPSPPSASTPPTTAPSTTLATSGTLPPSSGDFLWFVALSTSTQPRSNK